MTRVDHSKNCLLWVLISLLNQGRPLDGVMFALVTLCGIITTISVVFDLVAYVANRRYA